MALFKHPYASGAHQQHSEALARRKVDIWLEPP